MSVELKTQLEEYARFLVSDISPVEHTEIEDRAVALRPSTSAKSRSRLPAWAYALVAAGLVLLLGLMTLLGPPPDEPTTSVTQPVSTSGGWIAYSAPESSLAGTVDTSIEAFSDIFITSSDHGPRRVIGSDNDGLEQTCPTFSPDGTMLAYLEASSPSRPSSDQEMGAVHHVVVGSLDDGFEELARFNASRVFGGCVTWSPDSTRVAYPVAFSADSRGPNGDEVGVGSLDGETQTLETGLVFGYGQVDLGWSKDGASIAVIASGSLVLLPVDGGPSTELAAQEGYWEHSSLDWSPDGSRLVIRWQACPGAGGCADPDDESTLQVITVGEEKVLKLSVPAARELPDKFVWSPEGTRIAYLAPSEQSVGVLEVESGEVVLLPLDPIPHQLVAGPVWSPDGSELLVATVTSDGGALVTVPVDADQEPVVIQTLDGPVDPNNGLSWQTSGS